MNTKASLLNRLDMAWKDRTIKTRWLELEQFIRDTYNCNELDDSAKLTMIGEGIGAWTGRGTC